MRFYLCGHGNHNIRQNGFFSLPPNTTVTIYTLPARLLHQKDVEAIVAGRPNLTPARLIEGMGTCPNLTLSVDSETDKKSTEGAFKNNPNRDTCQLFFVNDYKKPASEDDEPSMTLQEIVSAYPGNDFVWTCCYNIPLGRTPLGAKYGMNVIQYVQGGAMHQSKTQGGGSGFELNRGDMVTLARGYLQSRKLPSTPKDATAYMSNLDSTRGPGG